MRAYGRDGQRVVTQNLPEGLHRQCLDHLRAGETKYDVVASHPLQREEWAKAWVDGFREHGYRVSAVYIATNESNSLLGIADRYQKSVDERGYGRWVSPDMHDESYSGVPDVAHRLETEAYVDSLYVVNRDGYVLHENHRGPDGQMTEPARAREVLDQERNRPPTQEEREFFDRKATALLERDPNAPPDQRHPDPVDETTHGTVREARDREYRRPDPTREDTDHDPGNRIDQRLRAASERDPASSTPATEADSRVDTSAAGSVPPQEPRGEEHGSTGQEEPEQPANPPSGATPAGADQGSDADTTRSSSEAPRDERSGRPESAAEGQTPVERAGDTPGMYTHRERGTVPAEQQPADEGETAQQDRREPEPEPEPNPAPERSDPAARSRETADKLRQVNEARRERQEAGVSGGAGRDEGGESSREPER